MDLQHVLRIVCPAAAALAALCATPALAQEAPLKIGIVVFMSGQAAAPFGVPAKNAAELMAETLNKGGVLGKPYDKKGFGGRAIELVFVDEAGGTTKQVQEYRNLVQRQNVDMVIGYIGSGDCLAVGPVAEELKKLTIFFDCGSPRIFEDASYKYVFRTGAHGVMDNVALAMYTLKRNPNVKTIVGINQNYAWGQDSWNDFIESMKVLKPDVKILEPQWPKLGAGQYNAEISALLAADADVVHTSLWGGDLESFILQAAPRDLFKKSLVVLSAGEHVVDRLETQVPEGTPFGARGPHNYYAPDGELNRWLRKSYQERYKLTPIQATYKMVQAFLGVKSAYEKAMDKNGGKQPDQEQIIAALENHSWEGPSGKVEMKLGKGHQAVQGTAIGTVKHQGGKVVATDIERYAADKVNPPEGIKSLDWIKAGFK
jgi:branched-chain amino acid transport system substrate-binding protein